jgi:hypothetical protein
LQGQHEIEEYCMTEMEEILKEIAKTRAEQAAQMKTGVPAGVRLGPLTSTIRNGAIWATQDQFPSDQIWADDVEQILSFAQVQGQQRSAYPCKDQSDFAARDHS